VILERGNFFKNPWSNLAPVDWLNYHPLKMVFIVPRIIGMILYSEKNTSRHLIFTSNLKFLTTHKHRTNSPLLKRLWGINGVNLSRECKTLNEITEKWAARWPIKHKCRLTEVFLSMGSPFVVCFSKAFMFTSNIGPVWVKTQVNRRTFCHAKRVVKSMKTRQQGIKFFH